MIGKAFKRLVSGKGGSKSGSTDPQEGGQAARPAPGRGMLGRLAAKAQEQGGMPMSGGGRGMIGRLTNSGQSVNSSDEEPMTGNRAMGVLNRVARDGMRKNAFSMATSAADRSGGMKSGGKVKGFRDGGIYTAEMGQPPQDIDGGSASLKKPAPKKTQAKKPAPKKPVATKNFAKGGSIDGIAQRGKTNCKMR